MNWFHTPLGSLNLEDVAEIVYSRPTSADGLLVATLKLLTDAEPKQLFGPDAERLQAQTGWLNGGWTIASESVAPTLTVEEP